MNKEDLKQFLTPNLISKFHDKGIFINVTLEYGKTESEIVITLPLSQEGKKQTDFFIRIINETLKQMLDNPDSYSEKIAKTVSEELSLDFKETEKMINKFARSDDGGYFAMPVAYSIEVHDGNGGMIMTDTVIIEEY